MIEGNKLKGLNRIGLKLTTCDWRRETSVCIIKVYYLGTVYISIITIS
jgi:hypothetical protein